MIVIVVNAPSLCFQVHRLIWHQCMLPRPASGTQAIIMTLWKPQLDKIQPWKLQPASARLSGVVWVDLIGSCNPACLCVHRSLQPECSASESSDHANKLDNKLLVGRCCINLITSHWQVVIVILANAVESCVHLSWLDVPAAEDLMWCSAGGQSIMLSLRHWESWLHDRLMIMEWRESQTCESVSSYICWYRLLQEDDACLMCIWGAACGPGVLWPSLWAQ